MLGKLARPFNSAKPVDWWEDCTRVEGRESGEPDLLCQRYFRLEPVG
jgi:hypothetical protein